MNTISTLSLKVGAEPKRFMLSMILVLMNNIHVKKSKYSNEVSTKEDFETSKDEGNTEAIEAQKTTVINEPKVVLQIKLVMVQHMRPT